MLTRSPDAHFGTANKYGDDLNRPIECYYNGSDREVPITRLARQSYLTSGAGVLHTFSSACPHGGFRMIKSFDITDFRCFGRVQMNGLTRINVITGENGSGKSALLEALYIGANATATSILNIAVMRAQAPNLINVMAQGFGFLVSPNGQPASLAPYFDPLFRSQYRMDQQTGESKVHAASEIKLSFTDSDSAAYNLTIAYQNGVDQTPVPVPQMRLIGSQPGVAPIILTREKKAHHEIQEQSQIPVTVVAQTGQLQQPVTAPFGPATFIFSADMNYAEIDNITWFSQLKERNQAEQLISWVKQEFPFVKGIEVLAPTGSSGLYAIMSNDARRRLTSVSSGIYKIISILLASAHTRNGIIIIDEIENGIFYEKYPAVWRILYKFAQDTGNQIFVSSHSRECLEALPPVIGESTNDFCLLRTEREQDECIVRHISGTAMKAALRGGNEIRGMPHGLASN